MRVYLIDAIVFLVGALGMIFEVAGSRIMGPYLGTSVFVWTSLIGVIFASLSLGYWLGGILSTRKINFLLLALMLLISSFFVLTTAKGNIYLLDRIVRNIQGIRIRAVVGSVVLFAPASVFFGMVLPYAARIRISSLRVSGSAIGRIYALSTAGSIAGTFLAGFYLLPTMGHLNILYAMSLILVILSLILLFGERRYVWMVLPLTVAVAAVVFRESEKNEARDYVDIDTRYNRVIVFPSTDSNTGRPIRLLRVNDENSSAMFLDQDDDLVFEVLKYYRMVGHFVPNFNHTLMIGGSGYAFPKDYLIRNPHATIDVVEIDPGLTDIARQFFNLPEDPRLQIFHEDGRTYLNRNQQKYDAVFMDAYKSMITIPYQLTTREAVVKIYDALNEGGVVFANIISTLNPAKNQFLHAATATYLSVFPQAYLFAVQFPDPSEKELDYFQNIMLVGVKSHQPVVFYSENPEYNTYLAHRIIMDQMDQSIILTDEYAPVEYFASRVLK